MGSIYLLLGLVLMLFLAWRAVEWKTYDKDNIAVDQLDVGDDLLEDVPITQQLTPHLHLPTTSTRSD